MPLSATVWLAAEPPPPKAVVGITAAAASARLASTPTLLLLMPSSLQCSFVGPAGPVSDRDAAARATFPGLRPRASGHRPWAHQTSPARSLQLASRSSVAPSTPRPETTHR